MDKITITVAEAEDSENITLVQYTTWLATYPNKEYGITIEDIEDRFKEKFTPENIQKNKDRIANPPNNNRLFVAKDNQVVVGLCLAIIKEDRNQLQVIYVLPEYQGKGIGTLLWNATLNFFDENKDIYVELAVYNKTAEEFYKRLGFIDTGRRIKDEKFKMKSGNIIPEMEMIIKR